MSHPRNVKPSLSGIDPSHRACVAGDTAHPVVGNVVSGCVGSSSPGGKSTPSGRLVERHGSSPPPSCKTQRIHIQMASNITSSMQDSQNANIASESKTARRLMHGVDQDGSPRDNSSQPAKQNGPSFAASPSSMETGDSSALPSLGPAIKTMKHTSSTTVTTLLKTSTPAQDSISSNSMSTGIMDQSSPAVVRGLAAATTVRPPTSPTETASPGSTPKKRDRDSASTQVMPDTKRARTPQRKAISTPKRSPLSADEKGLLYTNETLPDTPAKDEGEKVESADNVVEGLAKLPEDSLAMRHESWRKLRDTDNDINGRKRTDVLAKPTTVALQTATAEESIPSLKEPPVQKRKTFPPFVSRYARSAKPSPHESPVAGPSMRPPSVHQGSRRSGDPSVHPPTFLPNQMRQSAGGSVPVPAYNRTVPPMAPPDIPPRPASIPPSGTWPAHDHTAPRASRMRSFKVTKDEIRDAIPKNASCVFHIMDRRVNLDSFSPDASFYSLMRAWALDDPYRQIPPQGSNILELVSLPSESRANLKRSNTAQPKKTERDELNVAPVDVMSEVKAEQSKPSITRLRGELVAKGRLLKQKKRKEDSVWMDASRASLKSMGIDLAEPKRRGRRGRQ